MITSFWTKRPASVAVAVLSTCAAAGAAAQPNGLFCGPPNMDRSKLIVPFAPGGTVDEVARSMSHVIVDNRAGAGGVIGSDAVAKAPPDGGTLLLTNAVAHLITPSLKRNLPYDPVRDFIPVASIAEVPLVLVAHPSLRVEPGSNLVASLKASKTPLFFAASSTGSIDDVVGAQMAKQFQLALTRVPYKGQAPALTDVVGGQVQLAIMPARVVAPELAAGRLKALAVLRANRLASLPTVPTASEVGMNGLQTASWIGLFVPKGTSEKIIGCLRQSTAQYQGQSETRERLGKVGIEVFASQAEAFTTMINADRDRWARVIRENDIKE